MLDKLPVQVQHILIVAVVAALSVLGQVAVTGWSLHLLAAAADATVAAVIGALLLWLTPLTRTYGVGSAPSTVPAVPMIDPARVYADAPPVPEAVALEASPVQLVAPVKDATTPAGTVSTDASTTA